MKFDENGVLHICKEEVVAAFSQALATLFKNDKELFDLNVQERTIATRFAMYLHEYFSFVEANGIKIDVEYNRDGADMKRRHPQDQDGWIAPDIILHQRGSGVEGYKNDIFYCEVKKNSHSDASDAEKVKEQMRERKYKYGIDLYRLKFEDVSLDFYLFENSPERSGNIIKIPYKYDSTCGHLVRKKSTQTRT